MPSIEAMTRFTALPIHAIGLLQLPCRSQQSGGDSLDTSSPERRGWIPTHLYPNELSWLDRWKPDEGPVYTRYIFRSGEAIYSSEHHHIPGVRCYSTGENHQTCLLLTERAETEFITWSKGTGLKSVKPLASE